ncbi:MAG TPA: hypothetical protein VG714_01385 [Acidobacteriaceae bacterium]|nr:hypothetical protein [Acidobacteriaceae bacterium]
MDWTDLSIFVVAVFMTILTAVIGSIVILGRWMTEQADGTATMNKQWSADSYLLIAGVAFTLLGIPVGWFVPHNSQSVAWATTLLIAATCIVSAVALELRRPLRPGQGLFRIVSVILLLTNLAGATLLTLELLHVPLH